jgi:hypothetical protein
VSGPKVVRVVTREELMARAEQMLVRLEHSLEQWRLESAALGQLTSEDESRFLQRHTDMRQLLRDDKFDELTKQVAHELEFIGTDLTRRREAAARAQAALVTRRLRARENAQVLLAALSDKAPPPPAEVLAGLRSLTSSSSVEDADKALGLAQRYLTSQLSRSELTEAQRELAVRLSNGETTPSLTDWKHTQVTADDARRTDAIAARIASLEILGESDRAQQFFAQLEGIRVASPGSSRDIQLDSLTLELVAAAAEANARVAAVREANELIASLTASCAAESTELRASLMEGIQQRDLRLLSSVLERGRTLLDTDLQRKAANARRAVVLRGLAKLGYEVNEAMAGAWCQDGRIVISKPGLSGYGVELRGNTDLDRMQVRAVALSGERDTSRDTQAETQWCTDFTTLQQALARDGNAVAIERALPVGATPLKVIAKQEAGSSQGAAGSTGRGLR